MTLLIHVCCVNKKYYVLNDFYKNKNLLDCENVIKLRIETREVSDWQIYKENKETKNNIIKFSKSIAL